MDMRTKAGQTFVALADERGGIQLFGYKESALVLADSVHFDAFVTSVRLIPPGNGSLRIQPEGPFAHRVLLTSLLLVSGAKALEWNLLVACVVESAVVYRLESV
jgi:hypothetical protein